MKILYDMIQKRATDRFWDDDLPLSHEKIKRWSDHWFSEARQLKSEFEDQGLLDTANHLQKIIDDAPKI